MYTNKLSISSLILVLMTIQQSFAMDTLALQEAATINGIHFISECSASSQANSKDSKASIQAEITNFLQTRNQSTELYTYAEVVNPTTLVTKEVIEISFDISSYSFNNEDFIFSQLKKRTNSIRPQDTRAQIAARARVLLI